MKKLLIIILIGLGALIYVNRVELLRSVQRVDASSPQAMRTSIEEITQGLSDEEKATFARGMMRLSAEGTDLPALLAMSGDDEIQWKTLSKNLNGKSVRKILAKGKE